MAVKHVKGRVLVVGNSSEEIDDLKHILSSEYSGVIYAENVDEGIEKFAQSHPSVLALAFKAIEEAEEFYLRLYRTCREIYATPHQTILFCTNHESSKAYRLCENRTFNDYVVNRPLYDSGKVFLAILHGLERMEKNSYITTLYQQIRMLNRGLQILDHSLNSILEDSSDQQAEMLKQFDEFTGDLKKELLNIEKGLSEKSLGNDSSGMSHQQLHDEFERYRANHIDPGSEHVHQEIDRLGGSLRQISHEVNSYVEKVNKIQAENNIIMVVDDNDFYREQLASLIEEASYQVIQASSGKHALTLLKQIRPALILMDYDMPEKNGIETLKEIKIDPDTYKIPVVMLTGFSQKFLVRKCLKAGAVDYILKESVERESFLSRIKKLIEKSKEE